MSEKPKRSAQKQPRVVVADDDPIILQLMERKLVSLGCKPYVTSDGVEAWQALRQRAVDLAIVDLEMPNVDGFALIQCIRGHPRTKHLPVIVVTSRKDSSAIQQAFENGATSFLTKPVNWSTFGCHIEYLMRLSQSAHQASQRAQRAEAANRIKDAILRAAFSSSRLGSESIQKTAHAILEDLRRAPDARALQQMLFKIINDAECVDSQLRQAQNLTRSLCSNIKVSDNIAPLINILANAQARVGEASQTKGVPVSNVRMPDQAYIACDPDSISEALTQLLKNALSFAPSGTSVVIEVDVHEDNMMTIAVSDEGQGMEPEFIATCLSPFEDGDQPGQREHASMGLPLVKAIMEAHGGALEIRSMPGQGTTATLVVPADRVHVAIEDAA